MLINKICQESGLTQKAVEYYVQQGLIEPQYSENGYRNFTTDDASLLKEISMLRKLGIGIADIKEIVTCQDKCRALADYKGKMELQLQRMDAQYACINYLLDNHYNVEESVSFMEHKLDENMVIKDKLVQAFPGNYGMFLSLHFGRFLNEKLDSPEKILAYRKIVNFVDALDTMEFPKELEDFLIETFESFQPVDLKKMADGLNAAVNDYPGFIEKNRETLEWYWEYRNSDEFKLSPAAKMQQCLLEFHKGNGYYDIFIPNLKVVSNAYQEYCEKMQTANEQLLQEYPQIKGMYD